MFVSICDPQSLPSRSIHAHNTHFTISQQYFGQSDTSSKGISYIYSDPENNEQRGLEIEFLFSLKLE